METTQKRNTSAMQKKIDSSLKNFVPSRSDFAIGIIRAKGATRDFTLVV